MLKTIKLLCLAAALGVIGATSCSCGIGLLTGTSTWCEFPFIWVFGIPLTIVMALLLALPCHLLFRKVGLRRWWQYIGAGVLLAVPFWYEFAQPFDSVRWQMAGFFDSLNYLGSGAVAGFAYWWLSIKRETTS
jgi:hypothetical protein